MLYKLSSTDRKFDHLDPVAFKDFSDIGGKEKDLENLMANNLLNVLYENTQYMPIDQSTAYKEEADIYALDEMGNLVIFELKRGGAEKGAVLQILRYAEIAGPWDYDELQKKWRNYPDAHRKIDSNGIASDDLAESHQDAFGLERKLDNREFNNDQHLIVVGSAADTGLTKAVNYWNTRGISIKFFPYRVYEFGKEKYFEFFSAPYDEHQNPANTKGVLFDTNRSYDKNAIKYMIEKKRVAAFGASSRFVRHVAPGDTVFFHHRGDGLVAAAKVKGEVKPDPEKDALYRDVEFLTPTPQDGNLHAMSSRKVSEITGKKFFWARTTKVPYLSKEESDKLVVELKRELEARYSTP